MVSKQLVYIRLGFELIKIATIHHTKPTNETSCLFRYPWICKAIAIFSNSASETFLPDKMAARRWWNLGARSEMYTRWCNMEASVPDV